MLWLIAGDYFLCTKVALIFSFNLLTAANTGQYNMPSLLRLDSKSGYLKQMIYQNFRHITSLDRCVAYKKHEIIVLSIVNFRIFHKKIEMISKTKLKEHIDRKEEISIEEDVEKWTK